MGQANSFFSVLVGFTTLSSKFTIKCDIALIVKKCSLVQMYKLLSKATGKADEIGNKVKLIKLLYD